MFYQAIRLWTPEELNFKDLLIMSGIAVKIVNSLGSIQVAMSS